MNKTKEGQCPKCGKRMDTKRADAKQCRACRRMQQYEKSCALKKIKRAADKKKRAEEKATKLGITYEVARKKSQEIYDILHNKLKTKDEFGLQPVEEIPYSKLVLMPNPLYNLWQPKLEEDETTKMITGEVEKAIDKKSEEKAREKIRKFRYSYY